MLVIEDDAEVASLVAAYATAGGWQVETAGRVDAGLAAFAQTPPDVVVLDIMLPDGSGLDALAAIRARSDAYVVLLTAKGGEADRIMGLSRGADDYVVKPFSPGELMARCQALLRRPRGPGAAGRLCASATFSSTPCSTASSFRASRSPSPPWR